MHTVWHLNFARVYFCGSMILSYFGESKFLLQTPSSLLTKDYFVRSLACELKYRRVKKERKAENKLSVMGLFQAYHNTLCCPSKISQKHCFLFLLGQIIHYYWFARNVTAFVFGHVGGNWTHVFMSILREKILLYWTPTSPPCHVVAHHELP